jgi:signal transduction histidine kinase
MEALFIGLLCHFESGPESPFRFYYLMSLICCAMRYPPRTTFVTCALDSLSYSAVTFAAAPKSEDAGRLLLMLVVLCWVAWAAGAMTRLLRRTSDELQKLNDELRENQTLLETRIADRTRQLEESQAQVLHQEKMAAFGLLAAGIAHEVGNPLTGISTVIQLLERRNPDDYTREKLGLVTTQLARIQSILRELVTFSRPASDRRASVSVQEVVEEALSIAKFYKGGKNRRIEVSIPTRLPTLFGVRDQLVQVVLNLVLNAIDATDKGGRILVKVDNCGQSSDSHPFADQDQNNQHILLTVSDDGCGIPQDRRDRLFRPYFTTKKHGTGLGLFVTRRIVEAHGGHVEVESEPGRGTTFRVLLPVAMVTRAPAVAVSP